jgi:hypothetical protein
MVLWPYRIIFVGYLRVLYTFSKAGMGLFGALVFPQPRSEIRSEALWVCCHAGTLHCQIDIYSSVHGY